MRPVGTGKLEIYRAKVWKYHEGRDKPTNKDIAKLLGISDHTVAAF